MKKLLVVVIVSLALFAGAAQATEGSNGIVDKPSPLTIEQASQLLTEGKPIFSCGMKPDWFSDKPGQCPCCTMDLEQVKEIKDGKAVFGSGESQSMPMMNMESK